MQIQKPLHVLRISCQAKIRELKIMTTQPVREEDVPFKMERFMFLTLAAMEKFNERIDELEDQLGSKTH